MDLPLKTNPKAPDASKQGGGASQLPGGYQGIEARAHQIDMESMVEQQTKQLMAATRRMQQDYGEMEEALAAVRNLSHSDTEERSRLAMLYAREMAKRLYFSSDQFKRLEWAVETPDWSHLQEPKRYVATTGKLPYEKSGSAQTMLPPQSREAQEHGVKGMRWRVRRAKLNPPAGVKVSDPFKKVGEKNKMSNEEAISAMESLGHDFSGHEDKIHDILNKVRRDEWPGIVDHYVD